ncbi:glycosyltransferase family 4 protein [Pleurocapsales cyanobacterium LEGE 06147]|nr:glycosyltransferase family 4 protein [Pleurocapsales cyanobacterium LEGE 06147]
MSSLTKLFPQTTVFTSCWFGFASGLENSFKVEVVGKRKVIAITKASTSYGNNFTYLPLNIVGRLLKFQPDIIFSNSFGIWTLLALLFKPLGKWRVVIAYEGSSPGVDYRNSALRIALRQAMVRASDACITNSQAGKAYLLEILKAKPERVFAHPYEVPATNSPSKEITEIKLDIPRLKRPIFLFVGGIIPRKGLHLLLQACTFLKQQGYNNYTLLIVGDGLQQEELQNYSQQNDLTDSVKWVGRVDYDSVGAYFALADVFVLPTLEDTWGMVVLEAMVMGKPILCSKWAGASELVIDGDNGYCLDPYETERLAQLMRYFIDNPELAARLGENSQKLMSQYTPEAAAQFLAKVTSLVLEDR